MMLPFILRKSRLLKEYYSMQPSHHAFLSHIDQLTFFSSVPIYEFISHLLYLMIKELTNDGTRLTTCQSFSRKREICQFLKVSHCRHPVVINNICCTSLKGSIYFRSWHKNGYLIFRNASPVTRFLFKPSLVFFISSLATISLSVRRWTLYFFTSSLCSLLSPIDFH